MPKDLVITRKYVIIMRSGPRNYEAIHEASSSGLTAGGERHAARQTYSARLIPMT